MKNKILINTKNSNYNILVGSSLISKIGLILKKYSINSEKFLIVYDSKVPLKKIHLLKKKLKKNSVLLKFHSSEKNKDQKNVNNILKVMLKNNFNRSDCLIAVGGGIVGDVSAFAASIFKRGLKLINIPTTLLAQVDSSIGGKTGINSKFGKNLIGSFYQPSLVIIDINFLKSLPKREIICGYAEILKHAIIKDKKFFNFLEKNTKNIISLENKVLNQTILKSCKIKLNFIEKDFKEKNLRMKLNFGHTFAHALEIKNKYSNKLNHGEAVLIGMLIAIRISKFNNLCSSKTLTQIENLYRKFSLIKNLNKYLKKNEILKSIKFMKNDKKKDDDKISLILLNNIGKTTAPGKFKYKTNQVENFIKKLF